MKRNSNPLIRLKSLLFFLFLVLIFSFGIELANAQSVIYKKDGTNIEVVQIDKEGKIRSYKILNEPAGIVHYIGRNSIDSIRYADGEIERFFSQFVLPGTEDINEETQTGNNKKNFIGINIWPFFYSGIEIFYERLLLNDKLGFKNYFFINTVSEFNPYDSFYRRANYYFNSGINYYYLRSDMFRLGTGLSILTGQFDEELWKYNNDYTSPSYYQGKKQHTGLYLNASFGYKINKTFYSSVEFDVPLFLKTLHSVVLLKTEIAIKF